MNKKEVLQIIRNPKAITIGQLKDIEEMAADYPYFQGAHTLVAIGNKSQSSPNTQKSVVKAALYATDRMYLKELLAGNINQPDTAVVEPPPVEASQEETAPAEVVEEPASEAPKVPPAAAPTATQKEEVEEPPFEPDPAPSDTDYSSHEDLSDSEHDDLLKQVFANLEALKKTKSHYLEVERKLEDAEFEEAQAKAVKKATSNQAKPKPSQKKTVKTSAKDTSAAKKKIAKTATSGQAKQKPTGAAKTKAAGSSTSKTATADAVANPIKKNDQASIIDAFIKTNPSIKPQTQESQKVDAKDLSEPSQKLKDELVTENLALILTKQGKNERAVEVYEKLILKIPEKKAYFAARIADLQK
ncbi:MAG: hypothetical protein RIE86_07295 [Imperialibacter sp.]|uniref:hypothetical protein n=1 Tax=Imperialibacter sp. TaxID=2038411 RepID=UPI0032EE0C0E